MNSPEPPNHGARPSGAGARLNSVIDNIQTLVIAELNLLRARIDYGLRQARTIALLLVLALFFAFFTLMALVVGLLLALGPVIGAWGALALVTLGLAALAVIALRAAIRRARRAVALLFGDGTIV